MEKEKSTLIIISDGKINKIESQQNLANTKQIITIKIFATLAA